MTRREAQSKGGRVRARRLSRARRQEIGRMGAAAKNERRIGRRRTEAAQMIQTIERLAQEDARIEALAKATRERTQRLHIVARACEAALVEQLSKQTRVGWKYDDNDPSRAECRSA